MRKIILAAALCVTLALGLTACSGGGSSAGSSSAPASPSSSASPSAASGNVALYTDTKDMVAVPMGEEVDEGLEAYFSIKLPSAANVFMCEYYTYNAADEFTEDKSMVNGTVADVAKLSNGKDAIAYNLVMVTPKADGIDVVANSWWPTLDEVKKLTSADGSTVECCYYLEDAETGYELEEGKDYKTVKKLHFVMDVASPDGERGLSIIYDNTDVVKALGPDKVAEELLKTISFKL